MRRFVQTIGTDRDVRSLCKTDVEAYAARRRTQDGKIRQGTIASDLAAVKIALNWATEHRRSNGQPLLDHNPLAKVKIEREKQPRRPIADVDRYGKMREQAPTMPPMYRTVLNLLWGTGRRVGAVLALKWQHVMRDSDAACVLARELDPSLPWTPDDFPHGGIRWYAERRADNKVYDQVVPMTALARTALDAAQPDIVPPDAWVFPSRTDVTKPVGYHVVKRWFLRAEKRAELPHLKGGVFHPYRRGWATALKHYPDADVAKLGGWRDEATMRRCYVQPDAGMIRAIVNGG